MPGVSQKDQRFDGDRASGSARLPRRLLIIEDDLDCIDGWMLFLGHPDVEVETARDGLAGLERAWRWEPDAILLDLLLPGLGGVEIFSELRRARFSPRMIIMSGLPKSDFLGIAKTLGAYDSIRKPCNPHKLRTIVLDALSLAPEPRSRSTSGRLRGIRPSTSDRESS